MKRIAIILLFALAACGGAPIEGDFDEAEQEAQTEYAVELLDYDVNQVKAWCAQECALDVECGYFHDNEFISCQVSCGSWWSSFSGHFPACIDEAWTWKHCTIPSGYCVGSDPACESVAVVFIDCMADNYH